MIDGCSDMMVAVGVLAAIGPIARFEAPDKLIWHLLRRGEDYAWVRPALHARKLRDLEPRSGQPARRGQRGSAYAYNLARTRLEERKRGERAELAYRRQTEAWTRRGPKVPTGAAKEERR